MIRLSYFYIKHFSLNAYFQKIHSTICTRRCSIYDGIIIYAINDITSRKVCFIGDLQKCQRPNSVQIPERKMRNNQKFLDIIQQQSKCENLNFQKEYDKHIRNEVISYI